jgi:tRNA (cytidine56-2'-O)-methyltransferase
MKVSVLRIGHRLIRDQRITTHAALVARAFGGDRIYMTEVDDRVKGTLEKVAKKWGGGSEFGIEIIEDWKKMVRKWKKDGGKVIHLTMYGANIDHAITNLWKEDKVLVVIGAKKVPREMYELADYNIAIGHQPHSEIAALAIFLDRAFNGKQLEKDFRGAKLKIIPTVKGKRVEGINDFSQLILF